MSARVVPFQIWVPAPTPYAAHTFYDYGAPLPADMAMNAAVNDIGPALTDLEGLIARAATKDDAMRLRNVLVNFECRVESLRAMAEKKMELFDFTKGAA